MSSLALKVVNATLGLATIVLGGMSVLLGAEHPLYGGELLAIPALDSNLRFMGGLGVGLGLALLWITPSIERHSLLFRAIWLCALAGGIGRLVSIVTVGMPPTPIVVFTAIEVPAVPLLMYWQYRVATAAERG